MKHLTLAIILVLLTACQSDKKEVKDTPIKIERSSNTSSFAVADYRTFGGSIAYLGANIENYSYQDGAFSFSLGEGAYQLGNQTTDAESKMCANSSKGQHIHLIMDNQPYAAKYTSDFDYEIEDGDHYLLAFLSRSYHESIKTDKAHVADKITVKDGSITSSEKISDVMLFYSRPKGTYIGKKNTEHIMLDFYMVNGRPGSNYMIKVEVNNDEAQYLKKWQPYYLDNLPMGENTVKLTLVDTEGKTVDVPLNPVSRTFTLKEDPTEGK